MYLPKVGGGKSDMQKKPKAGHIPLAMTGLIAIVVPLIPDHTSRFRYRKQVIHADSVKWTFYCPCR